MIFIAGISPKIKRLDQNPRRCPVCGLHQAYLKRVDHYLSLFFIPILRVKKGDTFMMCARCEQTIHQFGPDAARHQEHKAYACKSCGKALEKNFKYCPYCGSTI